MHRNVITLARKFLQTFSKLSFRSASRVNGSAFSCVVFYDYSVTRCYPDYAMTQFTYLPYETYPITCTYTHTYVLTSHVSKHNSRTTVVEHRTRYVEYALA